LRGLEVADFTDHDDVRVLAEEGAKHAREGVALERVDGDLE
jgi:predicted metal-dependent phosphoesterase TrpH